MAEPMTPIRVCYADPPYLGMASRYSVPGTPEYHPDAARWDDPQEHGALMARLDSEFIDGWAMSLSAVSLSALLPLAPAGTRILAWVKPWVSFTQAWPCYGWEPLIARIRHTRGKLPRMRPKDWIADRVGSGHTEPFFGSKPPVFCRWLFDVFALGEHPGDELVDMFPGSGAVTRAWNDYRAKRSTSRAGHSQRAIFEAST